jgi:hypothetical protein
MFVKKCYSCGSSSVNVLRSSNGWRTVHQFCAHCGKDQTKRILRVSRSRAALRSRTITVRRISQFVVLFTLTAVILPIGLLFARHEPYELVYAATDTKSPESMYSEPESVQTYAKTPESMQSPEDVRSYVLAEAKKAGVWVAKIDHIVSRESQYNANAKGDLDIICADKRSPHYGEPVYARGLWQITRCFHPDITDAQAFDPEWSTAWALGKIASSKKLCLMLWTECRTWYN